MFFTKLRKAWGRHGRALSDIRLQRRKARPRQLLFLEPWEDRTLLSATWSPIGPAPILAGPVAGPDSVSGRITDNNAANATLDTNSLIGGGTINVGSPTGGGTSSIDAVSAQLGGAVLNLGTPNGGGGSGQMTVSTTMTMDGASTLNVGSASGAGGSLVAYSLTANGASNVNSNGAIEVQHDGAFGGTTTVAGGVITADNIDAFTGAGVTINGGATITNGPLTGNLVGEINASFTFSSTSSVTLGTGAALGGGTFNIDGPLTVDTGITLSAPEFVLQSGLLPDGSTATGSIGGGSMDNVSATVRSGGDARGFDTGHPAPYYSSAFP